MKKLIIFGSGDFAEIAKFYFEKDSEYCVEAFALDCGYRKTDMFCGLPVYDFENIEQRFLPDEYEMFIAIAYSHMNKAREEKYKEAKQKGYKLASYISTHMTRWIERDQIGDNCFILEDNTIQPFVKIGNNVILWSGNHIGHHAQIGNHVFIASHVVLSGRTCVGDYSFLGVNAAVNDHVKIAERCVIGSGALITRDTEPDSVYKNPFTPKYVKSSGEINYFKGKIKDESRRDETCIGNYARL